MNLNNEYRKRFDKNCSTVDQYGDFIESVQCELVRAGSIFIPRYKLEKMTLGEMNERFTLNSLCLKWCNGGDKK